MASINELHVVHSNADFVINLLVRFTVIVPYSQIAPWIIIKKKGGVRSCKVNYLFLVPARVLLVQACVFFFFFF